ncbi:uncharacterized protein [Hoplias malabaricus]|uniref:uncharacterized protein isoform X2 n=1 Tax=Hoplias malabaricus TaxID=27720 RepID=UPI003461AF58
MAAEGRTVRVSGLPVDMSENRLVDKIHIHFLRRKNGGGEISSVTVSKSTPGMAFITFEESEVALRLANQGHQVFKVSDKSYDIRISLHQEEVDPDEVLLHMSVTVDYSKLPKGKRTLLSLHKNFQAVQLHFDPQTDLCVMNGGYNEVQSLSRQVLASLESQNFVDGLPLKMKGRERVQYTLPMEKRDYTPLGVNEADDGTRSASETKELDIGTESTIWKTGVTEANSSIHQASYKTLSEDKWKVEPEDGTSFEDLYLIVDTDSFRYLHKFCSKEYQSILKRYRVEVLDVICQDITTLYLKPKKSLSERGMSSVKMAHQELVNLYQDKGSQLRKENISKSGIPAKDLVHALESLKQRLPKLMIDEDGMNVYLVGSKSDVSEAKHFIVDVKGIGADNNNYSDPLFSPFQSTFASPHQGCSVSTELTEESDIFRPLGGKSQDLDDLFAKREDYKKAHNEETHTFVEIRHKSDDLKPTHSGLFSSQAHTETATNEDIFSVRRNEDNSDNKRMEPSGLYDTEHYTDPLFIPSKSSKVSHLDLDMKPMDSTDLSLEELKQTPATTLNVFQKQPKSSRGQKTKCLDSGREMTIAANFSKGISSGVTESGFNSGYTKYSEGLRVPKPEEVISAQERRHLDSEQTQSLPFIKPSMNSNLKSSGVPGSLGAKGSALSKMDIQAPKGDLKKLVQCPSNSTEKKLGMMPAYSFESQSLSLGQMGLSEDTVVNKNLTMPPMSARRRSNSFSGKVRTGREVQTSVDLFGGHKEGRQDSQTREVFTEDIRVSIRLWLYLKSVYTTEIDNLSSDLQVKEQFDKEDLILCLRGADPKKLSESHHGLKNLIATVDMDFDSRTLPLSMLGLSESKDKTLVKFITVMKQQHEKVRIVLMCKSVMILGPKSTCQKVEATMMEVFHTGVNCTNTKMKSWEPHKPSPHEVNTDPFTTSDATDRPIPTGESAQSIRKKDLAKLMDQNNDNISKNGSRLPEEQTRATTLEAISKDKHVQDPGDESYGKMQSEQVTEQGTQVLDHTLLVPKDDIVTVNKESVKTDNHINLDRDATEDKVAGDCQTTPTSQKNTILQGNSQIKGILTEQVNPDGPMAQMKDVPQQPGCSKATNTGLPSCKSGNQDQPLTCVCGAQGSTVNQTRCGMNLCSQCQKEAHSSCKLCPPQTNKDTWGIKGTMSVRESTLTIPGFIRDSTLKIIYDIPDGIQGEDHPCPGAPFKGNRFEAFLPLNGDTKRLLPLLEKAFHKGLTFTVKSGDSEDQGKVGAAKGQVVWDRIPHKTRLEGGASKNGFPDSAYIKRLSEALWTAELRE